MIVQRIVFTPESLAKLRLAPRPEQFRETLFALGMLSTGSGGAPFNAWRRRVGAWAGAGGIVGLARTVRTFPDLYRVAEKASAEDTSARTATATVPAAFKPRLLKDLEAFHRVAVAPYWSRIASHLEADRNVRGQITLSGGIDQLLGTLHPAIRWDPPVLEVPGEGEDIKLEDSGLLLAPAFFLFSRAPVLIEQRAGLPPLLSYPVPVKQDWSDEPQGAGAGSDQALRALVGRTRAAVLQTLTLTCTTTQVGERVGISTAAASQHTAVLRAAGLISTLRTLNKVQHTLTPLGGALLRGEMT
ncbi:MULTISPECIES: hypothetical protein [Streptomyces]|uniref:hypothetical protein n=1 Tax=Streptomyces TaxID=1883 RepID=UPI0004D7F96B|nr:MULTISPECIES: hypothetical protein [Streptomyces]KEF09364.1 hypothetical protein DF17_03230 [Streptomyces rimosus]KUJ38431.1 hypothetical protein ADK46_14485 [Streptomyces rimosus subsp. rimosus]QDA03947.1 ArsR family transcriptional regulator [Streptomyces rimosus]QEV75230.1 ArsR family transcriptional regulator [Streptomyces rimosus]